MLFFYYCCLFVFLIIASACIITALLWITSKQSLADIVNFDSYLAILHYHMEKAYEIIYKDKIMIYSMESMRMNEDQYNAVSKQFAALVIKMIGSNVRDALVRLYGDDHTLLFNILEYFSSKYESDEIYKSSTDNLMADQDSKDFWTKLLTLSK